MQQEQHHRRSIRLPTYDYFQEGYYFVTICTQNFKCCLGNVVSAEMKLSKIGDVALKHWLEIPEHFKNVKLDQYIVMPNHLHGVIVILDGNNINRRGGVSPPANTKGAETARGGETPPLQRKPTLGQIIAYFKYQSTKQINILRSTPGKKFWQRNYYEHIIRNEESLDQIREYIYRKKS